MPSTLVPWDKFDFGPRVGLAYQLHGQDRLRSATASSTAAKRIRAAARIAVKACRSTRRSTCSAAAGVSGFIGVSDPACTSCNYFPNGLTGGYPTNVFTLPAPISFRGVQNDFRNPLVHKWNVIVQRELPGNMALELGYEGNHQAHQLILWNTDPCPNLGTANQRYVQLRYTRVVRGPGWQSASIGSGLSMTSTFGYGNYAAASAKLEKRFSKGLQFLTAYVWSHALANSGTPLSGATNFGTPTRPTCFGVFDAAWDIRHSFTTSFNYELRSVRASSSAAR